MANKGGFIFDKMNKRGQFYLIAAAVLIVIILGLVTVANRATVQPAPVKFIDLSKDYEAETSRVIDYGVYNEFSPSVDIADKIKNISETFAKTAFAKDPNVRLVYIFGNQNTVQVGNLSIISGEVRYCTSDSCSSITSTLPGAINVETYTPSQGKVNVSIAGNTYEFDLKPKNDFYFVVQTTLPSGETNVAVRK